MPHVIANQVCGARLCLAALLADATYLIGSEEDDFWLVSALIP